MAGLEVERETVLFVARVVFFISLCSFLIRKSEKQDGYASGLNRAVNHRGSNIPARAISARESNYHASLFFAGPGSIAGFPRCPRTRSLADAVIMF